MNPPSLAAGAVSVVVWWSIASRYLPEAALADRGARAPQALTSIYDLVGEITSSDSGAASALESVRRDPNDVHAHATLQRYLSVLLIEEPAFEVELTRLLAEVGQVRHTDGATHIDIYAPADEDTGGQPVLLVTITLPWASTHLGRLTPPPLPYIGRQDALHAALKMLESQPRADGPPVVIVTGPPGMGKTGFARMVAYDMERGRTSDLQIEVRLGDPDPDVPGQTIPRRPEDALTEVLALLGSRVDGLEPGAESRKARYQQELAGRRPLIVLDDAHPAGSVTPLMPLHDGVVVVTAEQSRHDLGCPAAEIQMPPLTPIECVQLLAARIGPDRVTSEAAAAQHLAWLSAGVPLAIVVMPGWFRPGATTDGKLSTFAECMQEACNSLPPEVAPDARPVLAALAVTYPELSRDQQYLLQVAGLFRAPEYDLGFLAAASARSLEWTRAVVSQLAESGLLEVFGPSRNRWRLHPLVAVFAYDKALDSLTASQRNDITDRAITLLLRRARSLEDLLSSPVINLDPALAAWAQAQLHAQRTMFGSALRSALAFSVTRAMHLLATAIVNLLDLTGGWPGLSGTLEPVRETARRTQDPVLEARAKAHLEMQPPARHQRPAARDDSGPENAPARIAERAGAAAARPSAEAGSATAVTGAGTKPGTGPGTSESPGAGDGPSRNGGSNAGTGPGGGGGPSTNDDPSVGGSPGGGPGAGGGPATRGGPGAGEGPGGGPEGGGPGTGNGPGGEGSPAAGFGPSADGNGGGSDADGDPTVPPSEVGAQSAPALGPSLEDVEAAAVEASGTAASPREETRFGLPGQLS